MPFATEQKVFGFKKEVSRGVAEASPAKFLAVGAESEDGGLKRAECANRRPGAVARRRTPI
jgi:hypothetical protein